MELAEERGLGLRSSLKDRAQQLGLPLPRYAWNNPYVVLTFYGNLEAAATGLPRNVQGSLTESEFKGWQWLTTTGRATAREYAQALDVEDRTARRHLNHLMDLGLVRRTGSGPSTEYEVA
jgi:predicted HTH transcriptional regulator